MIAKNDYIRDYLGVTAWHKAGYTGSRGLTASGEDFVNGDSHAKHTLTAFREIAPDRKVVYLRFTDVDNLVKETTEQGVDTMFVSLSSQTFQSNKQKQLDEELPERTMVFVAAGNYDVEKANIYMRPERVYGVGAVKLRVSKMSNGVPADGAEFWLTPASYTSVSELVDFAGITSVRVLENYPFGGTSCATPVLCGMAALVNDFFIAKTGRPLTDEAMYRFLKDHSVDVDEEGKDVKTGWGLPILPVPDSIDIEKYQDYTPSHDQEVSDVTYKDDEKINHSHKEDVYRAYDLGIMSGHDGFFDPKSPLTREQMASVAVRLYDAILAAKEE